MGGQKLPESYPMLYVLVIFITLAALIFTGSPSHKSVARKAKGEISNKKKPKTKPEKKKVSKNQKVEKDTVAAVFDLKEEKSSANKLTTSEYFEKLVSEYQKNIYSKLERPADRTDVVIRYYKKEGDENKISALKNLGFYVHERPSDSLYANFKSNAIYYGDSITRSDIEIIAYTLIEAGIDLKSISPSMYHDTWKASSLEIGTDTTMINAPSITLSKIRKDWGKE